MKTILFLICLSLGIAGGGWWGHNVGYRNYVIYREATFIVDLSILKDMRSGDITNAISKLEIPCYASASVAISEHPKEHEGAINASVIELIKYRKEYAGLQSAWSPTEQKLEKQLNEITNK